GPVEEPLPATLNLSQQAHRSIRYGNRVILKAYRHIEEGTHPEVEIGIALTENHRTFCAAPLAGGVEYQRRGYEPMAMAILHGYVPNEGDAWQYTLDQLSVFFEHVATMPPLEMMLPPPLRRGLGNDAAPPPESAAELLHGFLELVQLLG